MTFVKRVILVAFLIASLSLPTGCGVAQVTAAEVQQSSGTIGPAGLIFMNAYNPATAYVPTDVVTYQGSSYANIASSTGVAPVGATASATDWAVLAQAGATGATGPQGASGVQGLPGPQGLTGPQGPAGTQGVAGAPGARGLAGPQGPAGPQGVAGPQGPAGLQGVAGPQGEQGIPGTQGPSGATGAQGAPGTSMVSFLQGRRFGVQGDSISGYTPGWQGVVVSRTGMTEVFNDARPGRAFFQAFECWGNPSIGGSPGVFDPNFPIIEWGQPCGNYTTGLTAGQTFASSVANIDVLIIDLGTNDAYYNYAIGQPGDGPLAYTLFGYLRWVVETYEKANPSMRIVLVTPQYNLFSTPQVTAQFANAIVAYGNSAGIPVINMMTLGGVNAITATRLLRDSAHPSDFGFANFYGPVIAQGVQNIF